ncbi:ubiquitin thiolesterase [Cladophialophora psammophila CBS 110553]|uniref:Ubiquitin carboxyl-terminal hydrolase n=1 Tax=Cladophialophora psammophila CBS 110553 TaxID=1182543 RepID=W9WSZ9_9EURO|nr:ubiquitin thiolesterase [Cladophialophora psammophila CBS 110553]EXJ61444.1 ubiquitin thiolesterase [Cladophialophora psammophila CBS 110553]
MECRHAHLDTLHPPRPNQSVYREDCTQCFDSIDDEAGLDVCLHCFNGGCAGDRNHSQMHYSSTDHPLVLNIKRTRKQVQRDEPPPKLTKLAIAAETEEDKYDTVTRVKCYACQMQDVNKNSGNLPSVVDGVMKAMTFAKSEEVKAWEQEFTPCEHTLCLKQKPRRKIESQNLGSCSMCNLKENLWLCLECGNLGCGRAQFGGIGGNSHGLGHATETGHAVAVKLGSITPEGSADVYCYQCNEERVDIELAKHLAHWGINIAEREKTEKSLMEMQVEQNLKWDFSMTTEDGKELSPLFGPGFTGLKNIGNSCYLASTVQCLFALPDFQQRYYHPEEPPPATELPAEDLETQLRKLADGILSGRYSRPENNVHSASDNPEVPHQKGLSPAMFKHLIGRGHEEFSTMRQQDAFELLLHLFKLINISNGSRPSEDPVQSFRFALEQRLQCLNCKRVRYRTDEQDNISIPVPVRRKPAVNGDGGTADTVKGAEFEPVSLKECLNIFTASTSVELTCPACGSKAGFSKSSKFKTFPRNLVINPLRFEIINWVPTKLDVPVQVPDEPFDLSTYKSEGLQPGEEELPEDADVGQTKLSSVAFVPNEAALEQLASMGFPLVRCEKALHATGNADAEAAMNWLFSHMDDPDIDEPLNIGSGGGGVSGDDADKIAQLGDMGISVPQARKALRECNGDVNRALDWVFSHPDDQGDFSDDVPTAPSQPKALPGSDQLPAKFELQSIVCHKGASIHAGHYVAFIRKAIPGEGKERQWVLFNDEKVVKAVDVDEMKKFAYIYFFRMT